MKRIGILVAVLFSGTARAQFIEHLVAASIPEAQELLAVDWDGDTDMDIVLVGGDSSTVVWFENVGGLGTYATASLAYLSTTNWRDVAVEDLDGDNDADMAVIDTTDRSISWLENVNGLLLPPVLIDTLVGDMPYRIVCGDINADGDADIVVEKESGISFRWYSQNLGSFYFFAEVDGVIGGPPAAYMKLADFGQNGSMDIIFSANWNGQYAVAMNDQGNGGVWSTTILGTSTAYPNAEIFPADLDGDGDMDLGTVGPLGVAWLESVGGLPFVENILSSAPDAGMGCFANLNCDQDVDVVWGSVGFGQLRWSENTDGAGAFSVPSQIIGPPNGELMAIADVDGDGLNDIILAYGFSLNVTLKWYENPGPEPPLVELNGYDSLCYFNYAQLIGGWPTGGVYGGNVQVQGDSMIVTPGENIYSYTYVDSNACVATAWDTLTGILVEEIHGYSSNIVRHCLDEPMQLVAIPSNGTWGGILSGTAGYFDPMLGLQGTWTYTVGDSAGGTCSTSGTIQIQTNAGGGILAVGPLCVNDSVVPVFGIAENGGVLSGPITLEDPYQPLWPLAFFDPSMGPGVYTVSMFLFPGPFDCDWTDSIQIVVLPLPVVSLSLPNSVLLSDPPFPLTGGLPIGGDYNEHSGTQDGIFDPAEVGLGWHVVEYSYDDGLCTNTVLDSIFVDFGTGTGDAPHENVQVYPNPTTGYVELHGLDPANVDSSITVMDLNGRTVRILNVDCNPGAGLCSVDIGCLIPGCYLLQLGIASSHVRMINLLPK